MHPKMGYILTINGGCTNKDNCLQSGFPNLVERVLYHCMYALDPPEPPLIFVRPTSQSFEYITYVQSGVHWGVVLYSRCILSSGVAIVYWSVLVLVYTSAMCIYCTLLNTMQAIVYIGVGVMVCIYCTLDCNICTQSPIICNGIAPSTFDVGVVSLFVGVVNGCFSTT